MNDGQVAPRVVVITGASSGVGRGAAGAFTQAGATVVLAARRDDELEAAVAESAPEGHAVAVPTDVADPLAVEELARTAVQRFGRIDVWVNAAGVAALGRFEEVPLADHARVIETDLLGTMYGSYFAIQQFKRQGAGTLINVSSVLGKVPAPYWASYVAAKFGVVGLSAALRQELSLSDTDTSKIHVCTVLPMALDTPFFDHAANYTGHEAVPIPPVYDPAEAVRAIVRLADEPQDEVTVGKGGKPVTTAHAVAPGLIESQMARMTQKAQMEAPPPAPPTPGTIHAPVTDDGDTATHVGRR
jgi:NAD(P)-dependent dehydrogenase (short-subunit alcohol dehydrogenase family)